MKRIPVAVSALAIGALTLTGCSSPAATAPAADVADAVDLATCDPTETTLTVTAGQQATGALEVAVAAMQEEFPGLTIDAVPAATTHYADLTQTIVADIAVGKRPDVIMSGLGQLRFWVDEYEPTPLDVTALADTYNTQFLSAGTVDDTVYLAPAQISAPVLLVNQDLLDDANAGDAADIVDYDSWIAAAEKVTETTGAPSVSIPSVGLADWYSQAFVQASGGTFVSEDGTAAFADETGLEALSIWPELEDKGLEAGVLNMQDAIAPFAGGQVAFMVATTSLIANMQGAIGDRFAWTAVDLPGANGAEGALPAGGNGWLVLSDDGCRAAYGSKLIGHLLDTEAVLQASGTDYSYIPVDSAAAEELLASDAVTPPLSYAWSYDAELTPWGGFAGSVTAEINDALTTMAQQLQTGTPAEDAVTAAADAIDALAGE